MVGDLQQNDSLQYRKLVEAESKWCDVANGMVDWTPLFTDLGLKICR